MKSRLYYILFLVYVIAVAFVLYVNGVFTGGEGSLVNLTINIVFLIIIGIFYNFILYKIEIYTYFFTDSNIHFLYKKTRCINILFPY